MMKKFGVLAAMGLAMAVFALSPSSASAQSYSGNYKLTWDVTYPSQFANTYTYCLKLTDNGSAGFPHSGSATLTSTGNPNQTGIFQVIGGELVATFQSGSDTGEVDTDLYVGLASKGNISEGFAQETLVGLTGTLTFGKKGSCQ